MKKIFTVCAILSSLLFFAQEAGKAGELLKNEASKKEIEATKAELEKNKSALDDALSQQRIKQNSLERLKNEKQTYVAQLTAEEKENQQEIEKFEEDKR